MAKPAPKQTAAAQRPPARPPVATRPTVSKPTTAGKAAGPAKSTQTHASAAGKRPAPAAARRPAEAKLTVPRPAPAKSVVAKSVPAKSVPAKSVIAKSAGPKSVVAKSAATSVAAKAAKGVAPAQRQAASAVVERKPSPPDGRKAVAAPAVVMPQGVAVEPVLAPARPPAPKPTPEPPVALATAPAAVPAKPKRNPSGLNARDLQHFADLLREKRREIVGDMHSMEGEALRSGGPGLATPPVHTADMGTDNYEQEFTLGLVEKDRLLLREINHALGKIPTGTFGVCEGTGDAIGKPRLEVQPWARHSIDYARLRERNGRGVRMF